jgi:putative hydrolase of the HAD superfamily
MSLVRAIVFDLDDTLYPEVQYVRGGFEAVGRWAAETLSEDARQVTAELWQMFEAGVRGDTFDRWLSVHGHPNTHRPAMVAAYRGHRPSLALYEDVVPALESLAGRARLGLITEGARAVQQAKIDALGLRSKFDRLVVLGEEEREQWKPSRAPFDLWLEGGEVSADEAVYLADNPAKDFLGARRAGWKSVRVRRTDGLHRLKEPGSAEARPDHEVTDLRALPKVLEGVEAAR